MKACSLYLVFTLMTLELRKLPFIDNFRILLALVFGFIAPDMFGQTEKLLDAGLITSGQQADANNLLKGSSNLDYLDALREIELKKLLGETYRYGTPVMGSISNEQEMELDPAVIERLQDYLLKIKKAGIISDEQFEAEKTRIDNKQVSIELEIIYSLMQRLRSDDYWDPARVLPFVEELQKSSIVTGAHDKLVNDINSRTLRSPVEFLNYCDHGIVIDPQQYPDEPESYLEDIHRKTASVLRELEFTDFHFEIVEEHVKGRNKARSEVYNFVCTLKSHGKVYKFPTRYKVVHENSETTHDFVIFSLTYYKIFNAVLKDLGSSYTLHYVDGKRWLGDDVYGIIALTKEQYQFFRNNEGFFLPN